MLKLNLIKRYKSISYSMKKIKGFIDSNKGKDILTVLIVILVGLGSFQMGKLSQKNTIESPKIDFTGLNTNQTTSNTAKIENNDVSKPIIENTKKTGPGEFFGSNKGTKYYSITCSAGKIIKEENRIYFSSKEDAENAGYVLSNSC
jgi:hypothetical protein